MWLNRVTSTYLNPFAIRVWEHMGLFSPKPHGGKDQWAIDFIKLISLGIKGVKAI